MKKTLLSLLFSTLFAVQFMGAAQAQVSADILEERVSILNDIVDRIEAYVSQRCEGEIISIRHCNSFSTRLAKYQLTRDRLQRRAQYLRSLDSPLPDYQIESVDENSHLKSGTFTPLDNQESYSIEELREQVLELTNEERAKEGLAPLSFNSILQESAQAHADDMNDQNYFEHDSLDGRTPSERIEDTGYLIEFEKCLCSKSYTTGENIAKGQDSARFVVQTWMDSEGHRANILNPEFTELGVGITKIDESSQDDFIGYLWVQNFGNISLNIED